MLYGGGDANLDDNVPNTTSILSVIDLTQNKINQELLGIKSVLALSSGVLLTLVAPVNVLL